jgi:predicted hotdog family 3-hydroxylacyl-ACP dehydratase
MIDHEEICQLIPHSGNMCLVDKVSSWNKKLIECESTSHLLPGNPLRRNSYLDSVNLIEYGAQAMAIHGGLLAREEGHKLTNGYLAALRDVNICNLDISKINDKLQIVAECLMSQGGNLIYEFRVSAGNVCIVQGRATVVEVIEPGMRDKE